MLYAIIFSSFFCLLGQGQRFFGGLPGGSRPTKVFKNGVSQDIDTIRLEDFPSFPTDSTKPKGIVRAEEISTLRRQSQPSVDSNSESPSRRAPIQQETDFETLERDVEEPLHDQNSDDIRTSIFQHLGRSQNQKLQPNIQNIPSSKTLFKPDSRRPSIIQSLKPIKKVEDNTLGNDGHFVTGADEVSVHTPVCPDAINNYIIPDPVQCDKFFLCSRGQVESRLCEDGMVFFIEEAKCLLPKSTAGVCKDRPRLQAPLGTGPCIRQNGVFHSSTSCTKFITCKHNQPTPGTCAQGLVFDKERKICGWADDVLRQGCLPSDLLGFTCPNPILTQEEAIRAGVHLPFGDHNRHADPRDCRYYFICLTTGHPRRAGCGDNKVFNPATGLCSPPEEVPQCQHLAVKK